MQCIPRDAEDGAWIVSNVDQYHSEDRRDILGDRGHRYKRNTLGLSAAAIMVAVLPGVTINTTALPGVINVEPLSFWLLYAAVLAYNSGVWLHHVNQDWLLFQAGFEKVHLGHRKTLETGETEEFEPPEGRSHHKMRTTLTTDPRGLRVDLGHQPSETAGWHNSGSGIFISKTDLQHVQHKERHFLWWEQRIPLVLCAAAFFAIGLRILDAIASPPS